MPSHRAVGPASRRPAEREQRLRDGAAAPATPALATTRRERRELEAAAARASRRSAPGSRLTRRLPQVGVAGVLGLATIVAPLAGDVLPTSSHTAEASSAAVAEAVRPTAVDSFRVLPTEAEVASVPESVALETVDVPTAEELAAAREAASLASRELERQSLERQRLEAAVPGCDGANVDVGASNGRLSTGDMCELWGTGHILRADAAVALARLNIAYTDHFGYELVLTDSYRSYGAQVSLRNRKPGLAARPGTSEHGWGLAVDFGGGVESADGHYAWLRENAPAFGWDNPEWARKGGSGAYEPWHWEYVAGQTPG